MTTTDPFTEAAHAEAFQQWSMRDQRSAFVTGARWALRYLAAQEPTDAEVEAACAGFYEQPSGLTSWTRLVKAEPRLAEVYREGIRRALSAARAARRDEEKR